MTNKVNLLSTLALSVTLVFSCSSGNSTNLVSASKGGKICAPEGSSIAGACIDIPPNALSEDTEIELIPAADIIASPSLSIGDTVRVKPKSLELANGTATLTVPFDGDNENVQNNLFFSINVDTVLFQLQGSTETIAANAALEIESTANTLSTEISRFGDFQPGFQVIANLAVGDVVDIPMSESTGVLTIEAEPGESYLFALTSLPAGAFTNPSSVLTNPATAQSSFRITSSAASQGSAKLNFKSGPPTNPPAASTHVHTDKRACAAMSHRLQQIVENGKYQYQHHLTENGVPPPNFAISGSGLDWGGDPPNQVGSTAQNVRMIDVSGGGVLTYDATVMRVTSNNFSILVDDTCAGNPACDDIDDAFLDALVTALETNVGPRLSTFFGDFSDVDNDNFVQVILTHQIPATILGFYDASNQFAFDVSNETESSNEADILFVNAPTSTMSSDIDVSLSTACHELQHLIHFNEKTLKELVSGAGEVADPAAIPASTPFAEAFLNEGSSYIAETICGYYTTEAGPRELIQDYLQTSGQCNGHEVTPLIDNSGLVSFCTRGANFLFQWYLYSQAGLAVQDSSGNYASSNGSTFMKSLLSSSDEGISNYGNQFESIDSKSRDFESSFKDYMLAIFNDGLATPVSSKARFTFPAKYNDFFTGQPVGVDIDADVANGPIVNNFDNGSSTFDGQTEPTAINYITFGNPALGLVKFNLSDPEGSGEGENKAVLMRIE